MALLKRTIRLDSSDEELLERFELEARMSPSETIRMALEVIGRIAMGENLDEIDQVMREHRFTGLIRNLPDDVGHPTYPQEPMTFHTPTSKEVRR